MKTSKRGDPWRAGTSVGNVFSHRATPAGKVSLVQSNLWAGSGRLRTLGDATSLVCVEDLSGLMSWRTLTET